MRHLCIIFLFVSVVLLVPSAETPKEWVPAAHPATLDRTITGFTKPRRFGRFYFLHPRSTHDQILQ